jgi:hypothetical protein
MSLRRPFKRKEILRWTRCSKRAFWYQGGTMTREEVIEILTESPLFNLLSPEDIEGLVRVILTNKNLPLDGTVTPFNGTVSPGFESV